MADFITDYFVNPMRFPEQYAPYNVYNTLVYAIIAVIAIYVLFRLLKKHGFVFNESFTKAVIPFIFFGSITRVLTDADVLPRMVEIAGITLYPFITPGIYVLTFLVLAASYFAALPLSKKFGWPVLQTVKNIGIALSVAVFVALLLSVRLSLDFFLWLFGIALLAGISLVLYHFAEKKWKARSSGERKLEGLAVYSQALDGAATFLGVSFAGYSEQHILANTIFSFFGTPFAFFALKILFVLLIVFLVRREASDQQERIYFLLLITIFGLAPGIRDALAISLRV